MNGAPTENLSTIAIVTVDTAAGYRGREINQFLPELDVNDPHKDLQGSCISDIW